MWLGVGARVGLGSGWVPVSPRQAARSGPAKPSPPVAAARGEGTVLLPLLPRHSGARLGLVRVGPVFRVGLGVGLG